MRKIIISYYNSIETIYLLLKTFFNIIQNERDTLQMINTWSTLYTYNIVLNIQKIKWSLIFDQKILPIFDSL